jgi:hypothetical protein
MGCAFAAAAPASHATHYRINALVKHSRQPLRSPTESRGSDPIQLLGPQDPTVGPEAPIANACGGQE